MPRHARSARSGRLTFAMYGLFLLLLWGESVAGHLAYNRELLQHGAPALRYIGFLSSGHFIEASVENWEGEFLGMIVYVLMAGGVLRSRTRRLQAAALLVLLMASVALHAIGGLLDYNRDQSLHGGAPASLLQFMRSAQFWFQSLQNWQSAFMGLAMVLGVLAGERRPAREAERRERAVHGPRARPHPPDRNRSWLPRGARGANAQAKPSGSLRLDSPATRLAEGPMAAGYVSAQHCGIRRESCGEIHGTRQQRGSPKAQHPGDHGR